MSYRSSRNSPGTDQWPGWTPESEWQLQQACKLSVMISVFAMWVSFSTFWVRHQRSPRPCRESLQMRVPLLLAMNMSKQFFETSCHGMSGAWSSSVHRAFRNAFCKRIRRSSCRKHANSVWWSGCLPSAMISVMISVFATWVSFSTFELGIKEVPDLVVSPCKCRVPLLSAMNMSKQFFWNVLSWNVRCLIFNLHISLGNREITVKSCSSDGGQSPGRELRHAVTTFDILVSPSEAWHRKQDMLHAAWCMLVAVGRCEAKAIESGSFNLCFMQYYGNDSRTLSRGHRGHPDRPFAAMALYEAFVSHSWKLGVVSSDYGKRSDWQISVCGGLWAFTNPIHTYSLCGFPRCQIWDSLPRLLGLENVGHGRPWQPSKDELHGSNIATSSTYGID